MQFEGYRLAALWLAMAGAAAAQTPGKTPGQAPTPTPTAAGQPVPPAAPKLTGFPWQDETLHYTMNWQSGLPVGDVYFMAHKTNGAGWDFEVSGSAGVPGFAVNDKYHSSTGPDLCSTMLERETSHAGKKGRERTTFDQKAGTAERTTLLPEGGGKTNLSIAACARDAVAFSYFARQELGQGRMPKATDVYFGSSYTAGMVWSGPRDLTVANKKITTDLLSMSVKGPKSEFHFEVFYDRDPARTPVQVRVPLSMGTFTLDLVR